MPKNILIFTSEIFSNGGYESLSVELACTLKELGLSTMLVSQYGIPNNIELIESKKAAFIFSESCPKLAFLGLRPQPSLAQLLIAIFAFRRIIKSNNIDFIEVSGETPLLMTLLATIGLPCKILAGIHCQMHEIGFTGMRYRFLTLLVALRVKVHFYAISKAVKDDWLLFSGIHPNRVSIVYNSVKDKFIHFINSHSVVSAVRTDLNIPSRSFVLLYVGRLVASKGIFKIQKKLDSILMQHSDICLLYVGREDSESEEDVRQLKDLKRLIDAKPYRDQISFLGETDHVDMIMAASNLLIHIPRYEGFGMVLAEALHIGLPVIASAVGGIPEVLDGSSSILLDEDQLSNLDHYVLEAYLKHQRKDVNIHTSRLSDKHKFSRYTRAQRITSLFDTFS